MGRIARSAGSINTIADLTHRADHPRAIDRIIDYFGERGPAAWRRFDRDIGSTAESQMGQTR